MLIHLYISLRSGAKVCGQTYCRISAVQRMATLSRCTIGGFVVFTVQTTLQKRSVLMLVMPKYNHFLSCPKPKQYLSHIQQRFLRRQPKVSLYPAAEASVETPVDPHRPPLQPPVAPTSMKSPPSLPLVSKSAPAPKTTTTGAKASNQGRIADNEQWFRRLNMEPPGEWEGPIHQQREAAQHQWKTNTDSFFNGWSGHAFSLPLFDPRFKKYQDTHIYS